MTKLAKTLILFISLLPALSLAAEKQDTVTRDKILMLAAYKTVYLDWQETKNDRVTISVRYSMITLKMKFSDTSVTVQQSVRIKHSMRKYALCRLIFKKDPQTLLSAAI